jgi:hypothetical protein
MERKKQQKYFKKTQKAEPTVTFGIRQRECYAALQFIIVHSRQTPKKKKFYLGTKRKKQLW